MRVLTWLWRQEKEKYSYTAEDVNIWAAMVRRNLSMSHKLACVTDIPEGISSDVEIIPLPKRPQIESSSWPLSRGFPQCWMRLDMWSRDAAKRYGERFVCMDLDCVVTNQLDPLLDREEDIVLYRGTGGQRPYNGSMMLIKAGSRPQVYERLNQREVDKATRAYYGSDQAFISYVLGPGEATWSDADGVYKFSYRRFPAPMKISKGGLSRARRAFPHAKQLRGDPRNPKYPENMRVVFFPGQVKPRELVKKYPFIREHYRC